MEPVRLRSDLQRVVIDGFALPLGIAPGEIKAPMQGYTVAYSAGTDDEPDTYSFYVAVSHEQVAPILQRAFDLLAGDVCAIVEISSRDAYRQVDVFLSDQEFPREQFLETWRRSGRVLLEDGSIAAGANSEEPFVEVFLDQWKGISIIVPLEMRDDVEGMLRGFGLDEVPQTWDIGEDNPGIEESRIRPVLDSANGEWLDIDDVLLFLRRKWHLELNIDPETNVNDAGRALGLTLWHAVLGVRDNGDPDATADVSVWATAGSLNELELLVDLVAHQHPEWGEVEVISTDRVAFDERPDELGDLPPRRDRPDVHLVAVERRAVGE